jgi:hypothetical protein
MSVQAIAAAPFGASATEVAHSMPPLAPSGTAWAALKSPLGPLIA